MIDLTGKTALITGGSRGIGRATAILFARAGADVAITYQSRDKAALEVKEAVESLGRQCLVFKLDISEASGVRRTVEELIAARGRIDVLVNNAGIWTYLELGSGNARVWKETVEVDLDSVYYFTDAIVPHMKKQGQGCVINVSSTAGIRGEAFHSHYAATKGAINALTKSWAVELAPFQIRVNCVAPGWVDTDMCAGVFSDPQFRESVRQSIPLRRIPPPEDIAGPILFLASDLARHITGAIINVNGGSVLS
ncbi:MAG: SDR family NAD(P)-dependent oxidoreductase [Clostridiales bacterium]|nr:SDR family NAD(P)-dependent oxidoreductase [Clostridiales bacterium]